MSAASSLGEVFDAGGSSVFEDLQRLVFASYIATVNILTDSTLIPPDRGDVSNIAIGPDGQPVPGVDAFVVYSSKIATLSVRALIIVPTITLAMFLVVFGLTNLPSPWYKVHALQATVLYSYQPQHANLAGAIWKREGDTPYLDESHIGAGEVEAPVVVRPPLARPRFDRTNRTLSWGLSG